nr:YolD-like family protein [Mammaliicoccus sp. Marseille-Q6498]
MVKAINHNVPEEFQSETDYRNIPRKYLNPIIPKGRGMIKWAPFATMPEQFEAISQHIKDQTKIQKPILDESALSDLNNVLAEKIFYQPNCQIKYWHDGYVQQLKCEIHKFNSEKNTLEIVNQDNKQLMYLDMDCILEIE